MIEAHNQVVHFDVNIAYTELDSPELKWLLVDRKPYGSLDTCEKLGQPEKDSVLKTALLRQKEDQIWGHNTIVTVIDHELIDRIARIRREQAL